MRSSPSIPPSSRRLQRAPSLPSLFRGLHPESSTHPHLVTPASHSEPILPLASRPPSCARARSAPSAHSPSSTISRARLSEIRPERRVKSSERLPKPHQCLASETRTAGRGENSTATAQPVSQRASRVRQGGFGADSSGAHAFVHRTSTESSEPSKTLYVKTPSSVRVNCNTGIRPTSSRLTFGRAASIQVPGASCACDAERLV